MHEPLSQSEKFGASALLAFLACGLAVVAILAANEFSAASLTIAIIPLGFAALCSMESFRIAPKNRQIVALAANLFVAIIVATFAVALANAFR